MLRYGTVGSGVVEVIETNKELINQRIKGQINVKYFVNDSGNISENRTNKSPLLIVSSRRCNGKIVAFSSVPLRVYTVQGKRHDRQNVCP